MCKVMKAIAAIMLTVAVVCAACTKDPDNGGNNGGSGGGNGGGNNGGGNSGGGTAEGVYLGIIGFNDDLKTKSIGLLNANSEYSYTNFISTLNMRDGTVLYHAVNKSLDWLQSATLPSQLYNVSLITFTDGLDNGSTMLSSNYNNPSDYLNAVSNRIRNDRVGGKAVTAYAIGLKGSDVTDYAGFQQNLQKLSSNGNNYEVENWAEVKERFKQIARQLYNETAIVNAEVKIPGGKADGTIVRITFDNVTNANASSQYIQGTYYRENGKGKLKNVSYHGLQSSSGSEVVSARQDGIFYWYNFATLKGLNNNPFTNTSNMNMWYYLSTSEWQPESEFTPESYTDINVTRKSAVAVLVLDCSSSLANDFGNMKEAAIEFVELLNDYGNSNNGGGDSTQQYTISVSSNPTNGGTVSGSGTFNSGTSRTVTATANSGYTFQKWTENGSQVSTNANYTFTVNNNRSLVAHFNYNGGGTQPLEQVALEWIKRGGEVISAEEMAQYGLEWGPFYEEHITLFPMAGATLYVTDGDSFNSISTEAQKNFFIENLINDAVSVHSYRNIYAVASNDYNDILAVIDSSGERHLINITHAQIEIGSFGTQITITGQAK